MSSLLALDKENVRCRESEGGHTVRGEVQVGRREAAGDRGARSVQGRARLQIGGRAWGGAHVEDVVHVRDAGGVKAQRLVERLSATVFARACGLCRLWRVLRDEPSCGTRMACCPCRYLSNSAHSVSSVKRA